MTVKAFRACGAVEFTVIVNKVHYQAYQYSKNPNNQVKYSSLNCSPGFYDRSVRFLRCLVDGKNRTHLIALVMVIPVKTVVYW